MENQKSIKKGAITIISIFLLIALGTWAYVKYQEPKTNAAPQENTVTDPTAQVRITAKHQFKNGTHILAGEVELPTSCYILKVDPVIKESSPEQVTLKFTATTEAEICAQVITKERFKTEFTASKDAKIDATWNGKTVILNLIPVGENEDLNTFEVFIKG